MTLRILFVALAESVHTSRWIDQLAHTGWDLHLFPAHEGVPHPALHHTTLHTLLSPVCRPSRDDLTMTGCPWPNQRGITRIARLVENGPLRRWMSRSARLARLIRKIKPDIVHVLEMQRAGYLFLEAHHLLAATEVPLVVYSSWGNDIYHFGQLPEHQQRIRDFLSLCDYCLPDCRRDAGLIRDFGFRGECLGVLPVSGGLDLDNFTRCSASLPPSRRKLVALKGYDGGEFGGRALTALHALRLSARLLNEYSVVIYSASAHVQRAALALAEVTGLDVRILPPAPNDVIVQLLSQSRIALALSVSDGTPISMLEAMAAGAFPIQSDTKSTGEWLVSGKNGLLVPPDDAEAVSRALASALTDDSLVDSAASTNMAIVEQHFERKAIQEEVLAMYSRIYSRGHSTRADRSRQRVAHARTAGPRSGPLAAEVGSHCE